MSKRTSPRANGSTIAGKPHGGHATQITLTATEQDLLRANAVGLDKLKLAFADLSLQAAEIEDRRQAVRAEIIAHTQRIGALAREIASSHGVDVQATGQQWHLDLGTLAFTRTG